MFLFFFTFSFGVVVLDLVLVLGSSFVCLAYIRGVWFIFPFTSLVSESFFFHVALALKRERRQARGRGVM